MQLSLPRKSVKWLLYGYLFSTLTGAIAAQQDDDGFGLVLNESFLQSEITEVQFVGVTWHKPYRIVVTNSGGATSLSAKVDEKNWKLVSRSSVLPSNIELGSIRLAQLPAAHERPHIFLTFYFGEPILKCNTTVNGQFQSYAQMELYSDGEMGLRTYEIEDDCSVSENELENGKLIRKH